MASPTVISLGIGVDLGDIWKGVIRVGNKLGRLEKITEMRQAIISLLGVKVADRFVARPRELCWWLHLALPAEAHCLRALHGSCWSLQKSYCGSQSVL